MKSLCRRSLSALLCLLLLGQMMVWSPAAAEQPREGDVAISEDTFPDAAFRGWLTDSANLGGAGADGVFTAEEIAQIRSINVSGLNISSLEGIEVFTALESLSCMNNRLTALDVRANTALTYLQCSFNRIKTLDVSGLTALRSLYCESNGLEQLTLTGCAALELIYCRNNNLTAVDFSDNTALKFIETFDNQLTEVDLSMLTALEFVHLDHNRLTDLDLSHNTSLSPIGSGFVARNNHLDTLTLPVKGDLLVDPDVFAEQDPKAGYERVEWYADEHFTQPITGPVTAQGQTLYAKWLPNDYTIRFDPNGGSGSMASQAAVWNQPITLTSNGFTRLGYTFQAWENTFGDGSTYTDGQQVTNLAGEIQGDKVTLYAQWTANPYTVVFHANGGSGSMDSQSFTYGVSQALTACGFTAPAGQKFAGWALSQGGPVLYRDGAEVRNLATENGASVDLYAVWREDLTNQYLTELEAAFALYDAGDYTAQDWAALAAIYEQARQDIQADSGDGQESICNQAVGHMAGVATAQERAEAVVAAWESTHSSVIAQTGNKTLTEANAQAALSAAQAALAGITVDFVKDNTDLTGQADQERIAALAGLEIAHTLRSLTALSDAASWVAGLGGISTRPTGSVTSQDAAAYEAACQQAQAHSAYVSDALTSALTDRAELARAKETAAAQLRMEYSGYDLENYSQSGREKLARALEAGIAAIEGASAVTAVDSQLTQARKNLAAVPDLEGEESGGTGGGSTGDGGGIGGGGMPGLEEPEEPDTPDPSEPQAPAGDLPFADVASDAWYAQAVAYVYERDMMGGYSDQVFAPNDTLSRAQLAQILYNLEGRPQVDLGELTYTDVSPDAWYASAICWAAQAGVLQGYGGGRMGPQDSITREQLAAMLYRYAQSEGYDVTGRADLEGYADLSQVSSYAQAPLAWAVSQGIVGGTTPVTLDPRGMATRAQGAAMLMRFCNAAEI